MPFDFKSVDNNECYSRPCQHGSTCNDLINDYSCTCLPGYTGKDCENGKYRLMNTFIWLLGCTIEHLKMLTVQEQYHLYNEHCKHFFVTLMF